MCDWGETELKRRKLPEFPGIEEENANEIWSTSEIEKVREKAKEILKSHLYGYLPFAESTVSYTCASKEENGYGGKAVIDTMVAMVNVYGKVAVFPFQIVWPKHRNKVSMFLYLGFTEKIADGIGEWILDQGYGIAHICYQDMAADFPDHFQSGLARLGCRNPENSAGKLAIWAFGVSKVMDYLMECPNADKKKITVLGHSRLGKTALLAGAFDERFSLTAAIQSGAGGAALFREKKGEQLSDLNREFSHEWLCNRAYEYMEDIERLPCDQHFLISLIAPRHLYIGTALEDFWADPASEYLSCMEGTKIYKKTGVQGLVRDTCTERFFLKRSEVNEEKISLLSEEKYGLLGESLNGNIGWHCRYGTHYLSILDWEQVIKYRKLHGI